MKKGEISNILIIILVLMLFLSSFDSSMYFIIGDKYSNDLDFNEISENNFAIQSALEFEVRWKKYLDFECSEISIIDVEHDGLFDIITGNRYFYSYEDFSPRMISLNANDGEMKWERIIRDPISLGEGKAICDLDYDGKNEIIISFLGYLICYNQVGNILWKRSTGFANNYLTIADIDQNGFMNIITEDYKTLHIFDHAGILLWSKSFPFALSKPNVADLNEDGEMEILLFSGSDNLLCLDKYGEILWEKDLSEINSYNSGITIADIYPTEGLEILIGGGQLICLDCNGDLIWSSIYNADYIPIVCDLNNDGNFEIITRNGVNIACLDNNGEIIRNIDLIYYYSPENTLIADLDGDGFCEFIQCCRTYHSDYNLTIYCYDYMGQLINNINLISSYLTSMAVFDVDLNGKPEIILSARNDFGSEDWASIIYCININGMNKLGILPWSHTSGTNCKTGTADTDGDLLDDTTEKYYNTNKRNCDSDSDTIIDGIEILLGLDPRDNDLILDQDGDMITNYDELHIYHTIYEQNDTDLDGLSDYQECFIYFTNPKDEDTDQDLLSDYDEIFIYFTDPFNNDCDNDKIFDGWEILYDFDPFLNDSYLDHDNDGLTAYQEFLAGSNPYLNDTDYDNLTDAEEFLIYGTNPDNFNTDGDLMDDFWEVTYGTNPLLDDSLDDPDLDCLKNYEEFQLGTNPNNPDTDGDGFWDCIEIWEGTDPLNASSHPPPKTTTTPNSPSITIGINFSVVLFNILIVNIVLLIFIRQKIKKK